MKTVGIIGNGFVGSAIAEGFKHYTDVKVHDSVREKSANTFEECMQQDIIFVCVPTPMSDTGRCNLELINDVMKRAAGLESEPGVLVIKSTVEVGTTRKLQDTYPGLNIVHSPEFLTARTAKIDFITPSRNIVGVPRSSKLGDSTYVKENKHGYDVLNLYKERFPGSSNMLMTSDESELVKYSANCFFATKVSFFNEIKLLADAMNVDFETVINGVLADGRIGISHHQVPGHDGKPGFGGSCFPKDINALMYTMKKHKIKPHVLQGAWDRNVEVRDEFQTKTNQHLIDEGWSVVDGEWFHPEHGCDTSGCGHDHNN